MLELTSDVVFKAFMLSDRTKNYKARLIHLITGIDEDELKNAFYTSEELKINNINDKVYKTDIVVRVKKNVISIEMNNRKYKGIFTKNRLYASKLESEELESGEDYLDIKKIITINIDNFHAFKGGKVVYKFLMKEEDTGEIEDDLYVSYHVDLKNVCNMQYNDNEVEKLLKVFTEDINSLRGEEKLQADKSETDRLIIEAIEELERLSQDRDIRGLYNKEKVERKLMNSYKREIREKSIEEGMKKGMREGMREGKKVGIKEGITQGKSEGRLEAKQNFLNLMREKGMSDQEIEKFLGTSIEEFMK